MLPEKLQGKEFQQYLTDLVKEKSKLTHVNYCETVEHAKKMAVHAYEDSPEKLLEDYRPREESAVREYRLKSWECNTASKFEKSISVLQKIFNSKLYSVKFPPQPGGAKIDDQDSLETYLTKYYPEFDSIFMFCREVLLKQMIADPNGVIAIVPTKYDLEQNEYQQPYSILFSSSQVLDYKRGLYYLLKDQNTVKYEKKEGVILHLFTENSIITYHQVFNEKGESSFIEFAIFDHNFGILPVWFLGGVVSAKQYPYYFKSFFNAALPFWNRAIRLQSDLDGAIVNHLHPQKWEITTECEHKDSAGYTCRGGRIYNSKENFDYGCPNCKGSGLVSVKSPFDVYSINPDKLAAMEGKSPIMPPAGYINIPTEVITITKDTVKENIEEGLAAICMEIVNTIGANQSGIAKEYDRSELHSFMQKISDYMFDNHISNMIYFINRYRYGIVLKTRVDEYLPTVSKPTNFDTLTVNELTGEIAKAKESNINSSYIVALQKDIISKRFSTDSDLQKTALSVLNLDPFPTSTVEDKMNMGLDGTVAKIDVVISNNIKQFINRAIEEVPGFLELDMRKQTDILKKYANEVLNSNKTVASDLMPNGAGNPSL
jgi:hypothetical protein